MEIKGYASSSEPLSGRLHTSEELHAKMSVSIRTVPYLEIRNDYGTTVYIAKEVAVDGN